MKVKVIAHTPEPEKVISMAAKLCYSSVGVDEIEQNLTDESVEKFLNMLINIGHESPLEHVSFTFAVEGISRSCSHQIVRHRIASFSQQSQRYVKLNQFEYIVPPEIERIEEAKEVFIVNTIFVSHALGNTYLASSIAFFSAFLLASFSFFPHFTKLL